MGHILDQGNQIYLVARPDGIFRQICGGGVEAACRRKISPQKEVALKCTQKLWKDGLDWILLRKLVLLEHLAVLITEIGNRKEKEACQVPKAKSQDLTKCQSVERLCE